MPITFTSITENRQLKLEANFTELELTCH